MGPYFHFKWVHAVRIKTYQCMARCKKSLNESIVVDSTSWMNHDLVT